VEPELRAQMLGAPQHECVNLSVRDGERALQDMRVGASAISNRRAEHSLNRIKGRVRNVMGESNGIHITVSMALMVFVGLCTPNFKPPISFYGRCILFPYPNHESD
jgi:hypothetical protein